jgi:hypothetical protein
VARSPLPSTTTDTNEGSGSDLTANELAELLLPGLEPNEDVWRLFDTSAIIVDRWPPPSTAEQLYPFT